MLNKVGVLLTLCCLQSIGMFSYDKSFPKSLQSKMEELCNPFRQDGFVTYKTGNLSMERNTEFPIIVELKEGRWYQFLVVGDPRATKLEFKLGKPEVGHLITDKFSVKKTGEYWTQFSFVCPRSGKYLLTFFQRSEYKALQGQITILQRPALVAQGEVRYK